jgi:prolipoprotein diacylglyceryltransferase
MPGDKIQDLAIVLFLCGIAGARIVYMIQYRHQFAGMTPAELVVAFFRIDRGGIVFYGSIFGGVLGYLVFRRLVIKRLGISEAKLADVIAPLIAVGLAVGRIGCYLNGCCWGQPVCVECQPVPISASLGAFPLLPAHARDQVCRPAGDVDRLPEIRGLQTSTGFALGPREPSAGTGDPRGVVAAVEPGSEAAAAGLKAGDRIVTVNGRPNQAVVELSGESPLVDEAVKRLKAVGGTEPDLPGGGPVARVGFDDPARYREGVAKLLDLRANGLSVYAHDTLWDLARDWPRGRNRLDLTVDRGGTAVDLSFTPRTVPFFPTQLYETVSMVLLIGVLIAFQPYRRHDGQVMVVLMLGYAVHRFLNEAIRIEPTYALNLTLSQWISVGIFAAGLLAEGYLRFTRPPLPPGPQPLSFGAVPAAA